MAAEFRCCKGILRNGIGLVAKNYERIYWMELFIELDWNKWYSVFKWIGYPFVNVVLQILRRLIIIALNDD